MPNTFLILDRDGVINQDSDAYIKGPEEWIPIPGSLEAIARLNRHGYRVAVATNQSGLARGLFDLDRLNAIHQKMARALEQLGGGIEALFFCPHGPDEGCECRKPKPGLLLEIEERFGLDIREIPVVGDSYRDLEAAWAVGAQPILVRTGKGGRTLAAHPGLEQRIPVFKDLVAVADWVLGGGLKG